MTSETASVRSLRMELRAALGDRTRLSKLHSVITESINNAYGEEKAMLVKLRQDVKDALNCRTLETW